MCLLYQEIYQSFAGGGVWSVVLSGRNVSMDRHRFFNKGGQRHLAIGSDRWQNTKVIFGGIKIEGN
jgi:hypothetical protein